MIRIRVDQSDVDQLGASGAAAFSLRLGTGEALRCVLEIRDDVREVAARCTEREIRVVLPREQAETWMTTTAIGLDGQIETENSQTRILVEKDLGCRHGDDGSTRSKSSTFDHLRE